MFGSNQCKNVKKHLSNNKGSTLLTTVIFTGIMIMSVYILGEKFLQQKQMMTGLRKNISLNVAVKSISDYVQYGLKNRWCFTDSLLPDSAENCSHNYRHPRSAFRLLMPVSFVDDLIAARSKMGVSAFPGLAGVSAKEVPLKDFKVIMGLETITKKHPIYKIADSLKGSPVHKIQVTFSRIEDAMLPRSGDEVYIKVVVELLDKSGELIGNHVEKARSEAKFRVLPREVNQFALMLPGDMVIGSRSVSAASGSLGINSVNESWGVMFESPVYINGNLSLAAKDRFTSVYFNDRVHIGNGKITQRDGQSFSHGAVVSDKKLWRETGIFGGFQKGISFDSKRDVGLDVLSGRVLGFEINNEVIGMCIDHLRGESDLSLTASAQIKQRNIELNNQFGHWRTAFSKGGSEEVQNLFVPQQIESFQLPNAQSGDMKYRLSKTFLTEQHKLSAWATMHWRGSNIKVPLFDKNGTDMTAEVEFSMYKSSDFSHVEKEISKVEKEIEKLEERIEKRKKDKKKTEDEEEKLEEEKEKLDSYKQKQSKMNEVENNNPIIKLTMEAPNLMTGAQPHFRDVKIEIENERRFFEKEYNRNNPSSSSEFDDLPALQLEMMDYSCDAGDCKRSGGASKDFSNLMSFEFKRTGDELRVSRDVYRTIDFKNRVDSANMPSENVDLKGLNDKCSSGTSDSGGVNLTGVKKGWEQDFTLKAENSWHFAADSASPTPRVFSVDSESFEVKSILSTCTIKATVSVLAGFYVCQNLVIEPRSSRLHLIGTFIPTRNFTISDGAIKAGIHFYNMHHPDAIEIMKRENILSRRDGTSCNTLPTPHWHPDPGLGVVADKIRCSPLHLAQGSQTKNPMRWTSIEPDCARINPSDVDTTCVRSIKNFNFIQVDRKYGF